MLIWSKDGCGTQQPVNERVQRVGRCMAVIIRLMSRWCHTLHVAVRWCRKHEHGKRWASTTSRNRLILFLLVKTSLLSRVSQHNERCWGTRTTSDTNEGKSHSLTL